MAIINPYFKQFVNNGIPFMNDRSKGDINKLVGEAIHIDDFGFIKGRDGEYAVVSVKEHPTEFYFAGLALTDICRQVNIDNMRDEFAKQPIVLSIKKSKNGRNYMAVDFVDAE